MTKRTLVVAAAAVFAASTFVDASAFAEVPSPGSNACKGQGFVTAGSSFERSVLKTK